MEAPETSFVARYTRFIARHAGKILLATLLVFLGSTWLSTKLELRTDFSELLPSDDPGVVTLRKTAERMGDMTLLLVGVHSPDREANLRYAEAISKKLQALPKEMVAFATYHVKDLRAFFEANRWLYLSETELTEIRDRLKKEIVKHKNPMFDLGVSGDDEESVEDMKARYAKRDVMGGRFPGGVFSNADGSYVWVAALPPGGMFGERAGEKVFNLAKQMIVDLDPKTFHPQMTAHVGGPVATLVASRHAVENDILTVTIICLSVIALSLLIYFRRLRAIPLVGIPAVVGTVMAFAVAELAFGYVNSSTAFLGSIILGNGINYAIILIARYEEIRAEGLGLEEGLGRAIQGVARGTGVAAVCTSAAYASLMLTSFRGFYQFGVMAAFGVLFCWVATFLMLPSLLFLLDRRKSAKAFVARPPMQFTFLRPLLGRPGTITVLAGVLTVGSLYGLTHFLGAPFEYDFRKLNAKLETTEEVKAYNQNLDRLFGRWPSPTIILADHVDEVESIREALYRQDKVGGRPVVGQVLTVYDILPGTPAQQARKLAILQDIHRRIHDPALEALKPEDRKKLLELDPPTTLKTLSPADLPVIARRPFTEADGTVGRVVLFYPIDEGLSVWNGRDLLRIADVVQHLRLPKENKTIETSGGAVVFASMIRSVLHDGPIATTASLLVVVLFILLIMRPMNAAVAAIMTLLVGVVWMVGVAGIAGVRITFLNFIALPITFGIGAEYALNLAVRYRDDRDMIKAVVSTGGAVAICSWTTIVGYGSLLAASNQALRGFGAMAILGEVFCLASAILALPAIILWRQGRRAAAAPTP
jgi:predicted RND superfamily exporter protein